MKISRFPFTAMLLISLLSQPAIASGVTITNDISYGPREANHLDLCRADDGKTAKPAILLIHGGGWVSGDKTMLDKRCQWLAEKGFVAATVDYRLANGTADNNWPAQLSDVQLAMRWLRANAKKYDLDPQKICSAGFSAGGHLAVFLGMTDKVVKDDNEKLYSSHSSAATCVLDEYGMTDFTDPHAMPGGNTKLFGGATLEENPSAYASASPLLLVSEKSAPMLIAHGYNDPIIPFSQSLRLLEALTAHGVPAEFIGYPGVHGFGAAEHPWLDNTELEFLLAH